MPNGYLYDAAGNVLNDGVNQYLYDGEERICAVKSTTGVMTGYIYDAAGDRFAKGTITTFSCNLSSNGFTTTSGYVVGLNGEQLTETNGGTGWVHTHVLANGKLLATYTSTDTLFELNDWLGTRRADAGVSGCLTTWQSLPYGNALSGSGNCSDSSELHFTGKERDTESGNDYFNARYYGSSMGRFLSPDGGGPDTADPDPIPWADFENPQSFNLYGYVLNNPLKSTDSDGHDCVVQTRTSDTTENVTVSSGNCNNVSVGDGQTATYIAGTVDVGSIQGNGSGGITFDYTSYGGDAGVASLNGASIPDNPGLAYNWGNNAQGWQTLGVTGATMNDPRTYAIWFGASALGGAGLAASGAVAGGELTTLGDIMTTPSPGQVSQAEMVLEQSGKKGVEKAIQSFEKRIAEHEAKIQQFRQAGGYTSKAESEIQNFRSLIRAYQSVLK